MAIFKLTFFVPGDRDMENDERLANVIKIQNKIPGIFRIIECKVSAPKGRGQTGGCFYTALLSANAVDHIRQSDDLMLGGFGSWTKAISK